MSRDYEILLLADAYYKLLKGIDWKNDLIVKGHKEGLNKFLSNAFGNLYSGVNKYHKTRLISAAALQQIEANNYQELVFEHLVPKEKYIQNPCEQSAKEGNLTIAFIIQLLKKYWHVATITKAENALLKPIKMPDDWDGKNIFARYEAVGIELQENPKFLEGRDSR